MYSQAKELKKALSQIGKFNNPVRTKKFRGCISHASCTTYNLTDDQVTKLKSLLPMVKIIRDPWGDVERVELH